MYTAPIKMVNETIFRSDAEKVTANTNFTIAEDFNCVEDV